MKRQSTEFMELLGKYQKKTVGKISRESLVAAVCQLVDHTQDLDALVGEAAFDERTDFTKITTNDEESDSQNSPEEHSLIRGLQSQAALSSSPVQVSIACLSGSQVAKIQQNGHSASSRALLTLEARERLDVVIRVIKHFRQAQQFSRTTFVKILNKQGCALNLEAIWRLHKDKVMPIGTHITCLCNMNHAEAVHLMAQELAEISLAQDSQTLELRTRLVTDLIQGLVELTYADLEAEDSSGKALKKITSALLDSIIKKVWCTEMADRAQAVNILHWLHAPDCHLPAETVKKFSTKVISLICGLDPVYKVSQAISSQHNWTRGKLDGYTADVYSQILRCYHGDEILSILLRILKQQEVNWRTVLSFTSTLLVFFPETPKLLTDAVTKMLQETLDKSEVDGLIIAFLLARQGALEGPHVFQSYQEWFHTNFGDGTTSLANNRKSFSFLMKFLTDIVPYENASSLKSHIMKPPFVPAKCRPLLADYISLAKTRLQDLKEPIEMLGIYEERSGTEKEQNIQQAEQDVLKALSSFEKMGKVPVSIMEASIFRKPYYIGRFLPALLKPRALPDIPDTRMLLIESLFRSGKIPAQTHNNYIKACERVAEQLLDGVFSEEDEDMNELLLDPLTQIEQTLHKWSTEKDKTLQLSLLKEKIVKYLDQDNTEDRSCTDVGSSIDLDQPALDSKSIKVVHHLLTTMCKTSIQFLLQEVTAVDFEDLSDLLILIFSMPAVKKAFIIQLWSLLVKEGLKLEPVHIEGLSAILVHLRVSHVKCGDIKITVDGATQSSINTKQLVEILLDNVSLGSKQDQRFCLRLLTGYLKHALTIQHRLQSKGKEPVEADGVVPTGALNKFFFLSTRLYREARLLLVGEPVSRTPQTDCLSVITLLQSPVVMNMVKFSISDFVELEWRVSPADDVLDMCQRQEYYDWMISYLIQVPADRGGCGSSYSEAAELLLHALLDQEDRVYLASRGQHCRRCQDGSSSFVRGLCKPDLLMWFQRCLVPQLSETSAGAETQDLPVLARVIKSRLSKSEESFPSCLRLARCLMSHLLLNDICNPSTPVTSQAVTNLVSFIKNDGKTSTTEYGCLTQADTTYFIRVVQSCGHQAPDVLKKLLADCSLFKMSVIIHWKAVGVILKDDLAKVMENVLMLVKVVTSVLSENRKIPASQLTDCLTRQGPPAVSFAALSCIISKWHQNGLNTLIQHLFVSEAREMSDQCLKILLLLCISCSALQENDECKRVGQILLDHCPAALPDVTDHQVLVDHQHPSSIKCLHYHILRFLMDIGPDVLHRLLKDVNSLRKILAHHVYCCKQWECAISSSTEQTAPDQVCRLEELVHLSSFVKSCVKKTPTEFIQCIPQDLLEECDEDLQLEILRRK